MQKAINENTDSYKSLKLEWIHPYDTDRSTGQKKG